MLSSSEKEPDPSPLAGLGKPAELLQLFLSPQDLWAKGSAQQRAPAKIQKTWAELEDKKTKIRSQKRSEPR